MNIRRPERRSLIESKVRPGSIVREGRTRCPQPAPIRGQLVCAVQSCHVLVPAFPVASVALAEVAAAMHVVDALIDNVASHRMHAAVGFQETERVVYFRKYLG